MLTGQNDLQEWQSTSAAIIEACEQTRKLPETIEDYKNRVRALQNNVRDLKQEMSNMTRDHRREKLDSAARYRQKEVDLAKAYEDATNKNNAVNEREVQMWKTKFQTAQENGNNAVKELHSQKAYVASV